VTQAHHLTPDVIGGAPSGGVAIRLAPPDPNNPRDLPYIRKTWLDSFHAAEDNHRQRFRDWKARPAATISRLLEDPQTQVLVARDPDARLVRDGVDLGPPIIGWTVWTPGKGVTTIHYVYVRHAVEGVEWRRRGVMTALFDAIGMERWVRYTHVGEYKLGSHWTRKFRPRPLDLEIKDWLKVRGVTAQYEPVEEFMA
jgi:hypothetical protein